MIYDAKNIFASLAATKLGKDLWKFLEEHDTFIRMETAAWLEKPSVEGIAKELLTRFKPEFDNLDEATFLQLKRMIGHMTKQIMDKHGYQIAEKDVLITTSDLFTRGTRYSK